MSSSSHSSSSDEVILAVYDLSRGMARSLSAQILGGPEYAIDMVPHTGLVVYGSEYFFGAGAGIQREDPGAFRRSRDMEPVQIVPLGRTRVARADFERWCRDKTADGSYSGAAYDLLRRNCNNFSNDAARDGLRLDRGVPEWILQVPQRFLSSPMGMMMRPMLENMQLAGPTSADGASPFAAAVASSSSSSSLYTSAAASRAAATTNPWANLSSSSSNTIATTTSTSVATTTASNDGPGGDGAAASATASTEEGSVSPPKKARPSSRDDAASANLPSSARVVETLAQPLVSSDASMIPLCLKKLKGALSDEQFQALEAGVSSLQSGSSSATIANGNAVCQVLRQALQDRQHVSFALLLLRVLVLHMPVDESSDCIGCLAWIQQELGKGGGGGANENDGGGASSQHTRAAPALSPTARAAAWLTLSNAATAGWLDRLGNLGSAVDCALVDWNPNVQPKAEVRQAASGFLYNVSLYLVRPSGSQRRKDSGSTNSINNADDMVTSILCFGLEGLPEETDATCRLRRCMILGRLLLKQPTTATSLSSSSTRESQVREGNGDRTPAEAVRLYESNNDNWQLRRTLAVELGIKNVLTSLIATASAQQTRDDTASLHRLAEELLSDLV